MTTEATPYRHRTHMVAAGVLGLLGLATALAYMQMPHPYTMLLFLMFGQTLIIMGIALFGYVIIRDVRSRMDSIVNRHYKPGDIVFHRGDFGDCLYVINEGEVDVILDDTAKDEKILARLGPGEYFGEMALLSNAPRNATVRAATELHTLTIHRDDFASLHGSIPALRKSIEETMERHRAAAPSETPQETK